jgi:translocation and assembly module TamB
MAFAPKWLARVVALVRVVLVAVLFVVALLVGVVLHLDLPSARRIAVQELNRVLEPSFAGTITLERVQGLGLHGVCGAAGSVAGPDGAELVHVQGVRIAILPLPTLRSAIVGHGDLDVRVASLAVGEAEVNLDANERGELELIHAFDPRPSSVPSKSGVRGLRIALERVRVSHAWLHGTVPGAPVIDADVGLDGALLSASDVTKIDVAELRLRTRGLPQGANLDGQIQAYLVLPSEPGDGRRTPDPFFAGSFHGTVGGVPAFATGIMAGKRIDAILDVPEVTARRVHAVLSGAPLYATASAHAEAHGELSDLHMIAHASVGEGSIDVDARAAVGDEIDALLHLEVKTIDARTFSPTAPPSNLGAVVDVQGRRRKDGSLVSHILLDAARGRIADQVTPHTVLTADVQVPSAGQGTYADVAGKIDEEGAPTRLEATLRPTPKGERIGFKVQSDISRLERVRRLGSVGPGWARLELDGEALLASPASIDASLLADFRGLRVGSVRVGQAEVKVLAKGPATNPALRTSVAADGVDVGGYRFDHVAVASSGLHEEQDVMVSARGQHGPSVDARALVGLKDGLVVHAASVRVARGPDAADIRVAEVRVRGRDLFVRDAVVDGLGSRVLASLHRDRKGIELRASSLGIDLGRLGYLVGKENTLRDGHVAFDIGLETVGERAEGHAKLVADHVVVSSVQGASANVDVTLVGRTVRGRMQIAVKDIASFDARADDIHLGNEGPVDAKAWRRVWGKLTFAGRLDAGKLVGMLPADTLPISEMSGVITAEGTIARDSESDDTPEISVSATTRGLVLGTKSGPVEREGKTQIISPPRSRVFGMDGQLDVRVDGTSGFTEVAARVVDKRGAIVGLDLKSAEIPYKAFFVSFDGARAKLAKVPFSMTVTVPRRKLEELPALIEIPGASGNLSGALTWNGTAEDPNVELNLKGEALRVSGMTPGVHLDGEIALTYDGKAADVDLRVHSPNEEVLGATAHLEAAVQSILDGEKVPWVASAQGKVSHFPLAALGPLSDRQIGGHLSGDFSMDGLHRDARAKLALAIDDLQIGPSRYRAGSVRVDLDAKSLSASVRLEQSPEGFLQLDAKSGMTWGDALVPAIDPKGTAEGTLKAAGLRAAVLLPFLQDQLSELDGDIDADAKLSVSAGASPQMRGTATLKDGVFQSNVLGEEFHAVKAKVSLTPDGILRLEDASMSGPSGRVSLSGSAQLKGLSLVSADAKLTMAKKEATPVALYGTSFGTLFGEIDVKVESLGDQGSMAVLVDVPHLHVELPLTTPSSVMDLGEPKHEKIGTFLSPDRFLIVPIDSGEKAPTAKPKADASASPPVELKVHLADDVEVRRGTTLRALLSGDVSVGGAPKSVVRGQIRLRSGTLEVQGKKFEIERGSVSFIGDQPDNPQVNVTAGWTAQDGTRVYADFVGPLKTGKVTLRSEPARPNNEIVALILFGTADGSQSTPYASPQEDNATRVGTTAGGFASEGLSKGLDQLTGMEITTKIDTSNAANPRPEIELQIAKDISVQLAFVLGTPPPGTNPDTTYATIDWRFIRNWSLETTVGNLGTTIADVIWRHRY